MKHKAIAILLAGITLGANATAQTSLCGNDLGKELSYRLSSPATEVKSGEKVVVTLTETNVSDHTVTIWAENTADPGGLVFPIEVRDESGKLRTKGHFSRALKGVKDPQYFSPETPVNRSGRCVPLRPGESRIYHMELSRLYDIAAPGVYAVNLADHRNGHSAKALSNTVTLTVTPQ